MLVWLCGWAFGEVIAGRIILEGLGILSHSSLPALKSMTPAVAVTSVGGSAFLLVWFTLWTFAGFAAISVVLRMAFGRDIFTLSGDRWTVWRGVGPFGFERDFASQNFRSIFLRRKDRALVARIDGKTVQLSSLGAEVDRAWLRDEISRRYGLSTSGKFAGEPHGPKLPPRWESVEASGGTLTIVESAAGRKTMIGCLAWIGVPLLSWIVWRLFSVLTDRSDAGPGDVVCTILTSAYCILGTWWWRAENRWQLGKNFLSHYTRFGPWKRSRDISNARVDVERNTDSDGDDTFTAVAISGEQRLQIHSSTHDAGEVVAFARFIADHAGWPVYVSRSAEDESS